jgi:hypothetical protein
LCWAALPKLEEWSLPSDAENAAKPIFSKMSASITIIQGGEEALRSAEPGHFTLNRDAVCDLVQSSPTPMKRRQNH